MSLGNLLRIEVYLAYDSGSWKSKSLASVSGEGFLAALQHDRGHPWQDRTSLPRELPFATKPLLRWPVNP